MPHSPCWEITRVENTYNPKNIYPIKTKVTVIFIKYSHLFNKIDVVLKKCKKYFFKQNN